MEWRGQCSGTVEGTVLHCKRSEKADTLTFCEMSSFISKNVGVSAFSLLLQWSTVHSTTVHQSPLCHIALGHCTLHYMCSSRAQCPITSSLVKGTVLCCYICIREDSAPVHCGREDSAPVHCSGE